MELHNTFHFSRRRFGDFGVYAICSFANLQLRNLKLLTPTLKIKKNAVLFAENASLLFVRIDCIKSRCLFVFLSISLFNFFPVIKKILVVKYTGTRVHVLHGYMGTRVFLTTRVPVLHG